MPITPPAITTAILQAAPGLQGPSWYLLAGCVGQAVAAWALTPTSVALTGVVTGTVGSGTVFGKLLLAPTALPLPATLAAAGIYGVSAPQMAIGIGVGVSSSLNATANYTGVSTGAIGTDASKVVVADPASLTSILTSICVSQGLVGPQAPLLSTGIANGIAAILLTGGGIGVASGVAGPAPGVGSSLSRLL